MQSTGTIDKTRPKVGSECHVLRHARMGKLIFNSAVLELASTWVSLEKVGRVARRLPWSCEVCRARSSFVYLPGVKGLLQLLTGQ